ncbi:MAG: glycosyltransferase family 4 protein [Deltaproteobacteria bacterium]|nr:glycosyltransferase family 4 protein [Deltaproteobacteria bacterium]
MKILVLYDYPPPPGGLATQGDLLYKGLQQIGVEVRAVHLESALEKEWYYRWFKPDAVIGVGYWGLTPQLALHPQEHGMVAVPWLVADGYIANYREVLGSLPLLLVTSNWVKEVYERDGVRGDAIEILPVGCDTDAFIPRDRSDPKVAAIREILGVKPDQLAVLTVGGDAASKGGREVMEALARVRHQVPDWRYICKVWSQPRTSVQNRLDAELAQSLGLGDRVIFSTGRVSRDFMPYLMAACDIYAAPSRLEGFGMGQIEASACYKPVIGIKAMAMLDTLVHGETALLAGVAQEICISETVLGEESGFESGHRVVFDPPRIVDYRASVDDIAVSLADLMNSPQRRRQMGEAGRRRVVERFDYRVVARKLVEILNRKLGIG